MGLGVWGWLLATVSDTHQLDEFYHFLSSKLLHYWCCTNGQLLGRKVFIFLNLQVPIAEMHPWKALLILTLSVYYSYFIVKQFFCKDQKNLCWGLSLVATLIFKNLRWLGVICVVFYHRSTNFLTIEQRSCRLTATIIGVLVIIFSKEKRTIFFFFF